MTVHGAKLVTKPDGRCYWTCPNCRRVLGEIVNDTVVIKVGSRYLVIHLANDQIQRCPNCQIESVLAAQVAA